MRVVISIILLIFGLYVLSFWAAGSHGHLRFRPQMLEDWILIVLLLVCWGIPVLIFVNWYIKRRDI